MGTAGWSTHSVNAPHLVCAATGHTDGLKIGGFSCEADWLPIKGFFFFWEEHMVPE